MEEKRSNRGRKKKEIDGVFAERLSELLKSKKEQGIIQDTVANAIGVSRQALGKWANGETVPDILDLKKLANYFEVSADYLLGLSDLTEGDITLKKASEYTKMPEKSLKALSNLYKESNHIGRYIDKTIQSNVLSSIATSCLDIELFTSSNSIITLSFWNSRSVDTVSLNSCLNSILKSCNDMTLSSIEDSLQSFKKKLVALSMVNINDDLKELLNTSENQKSTNTNRLCKEIYGAYLAFNNQGHISIDKNLSINEIVKMIIEKLEENKVPCDEIQEAYKGLLVATTDLQINDEVLNILCENI